MSVETTDKQREEAKKIEQIQVRIVQYVGKAGLKYKYQAINLDTNETFVLQTEEAGIGFELDKDYIVPVIKSKTNFKNIADKYLQLIVPYDIPVSLIPEKEQAKLEPPKQKVIVITAKEIEDEGNRFMSLTPEQQQAELARDKPEPPIATEERVTGSQLAAVSYTHLTLPTICRV